MASVEYKVEKLNVRNYVTWKTVIKSQLMSQDLWEVVVETKNESDTDKIKNEKAKHIMYVSMEPTQIASTGVCETAYELWKKIKENHEGADSHQQSTSLAEFLGLKYRRNESIISYASRFELALVRVQNTNHPVDEKTKLWVFANSLPTHMKQSVRVFTLAKPNSDVKELITELKIQYHESETGSDNTAYYNRQVKSDKPRSYNNNANNSNRNGMSNSCNNNNKYGNKTYSNGNKQTHSGQQQQQQSKQCSYCKLSGHVWTNCHKLKTDDKRKKKFGLQRNKTQPNNNNNNKEYAFNAKTHKPNGGKLFWIIDSGASAHMTRFREILTDYKEYLNPQLVYVGDGKPLYAYGSGTMRFKHNKRAGYLENVLYVPKICENLFSVGSAMKAHYTVEMNRESASFFVGGKLALKANKTGQSKHYLLKLTPNKRSNTDPNEYALLGATIDEWHKRLGHCSIDTVKDLLKTGAVQGLKIKSQSMHECEACIIGKKCRAHHPERRQIMANSQSAILHIDTVGPINPKTLGGSRYFILATEEYSGYKYAELTATKQDIPNRVKTIINKAELESGRPVKGISTDNGSEFNNNELNNWLNKRGIIHSYSVTYTPQQNGRAERANRHMIENVRTLLVGAKLPEYLWGEALQNTIYTTNRLPKKGCTKTRYELLRGKIPDVSNLRTFGQTVIVKKPDIKRTSKVSAPGEKLIFVGYTSRHNTYRLYQTQPHESIIEACDVTFLNQPTRLNNEENLSENSWATLKIKPSFNNDDDETVIDLIDLNGEAETHYNTADEESLIQDDTIRPIEDIQRVSSTPIAHRTRSKTPKNDDTLEVNVVDPSSDELPNNNISDTTIINAEESVAETAFFTLDTEPRTIKDAQESEGWESWKLAMDEEIAALQKNKTWILVDRPPNVKPIKNKWVYKVKLKPDGEIERYKARLVAKGYTQIENVDYKETYAPVASMNTVRLLMAIANQHQMDIVQFDIKTAFLYGDLEENLYMEQPEGYSTDNNKVCKLIKSLYGLKQAPRQWNKKFDSLLKMFQLQQSKIDPCLYFNENRSLLLTIYVDDGIAAGTNKKQLDKLIEHLKASFELKVMDCEAFLGFRVIRDKTHKTLSLLQDNYVDRLLKRFGMEDSNSVDTPEQVGAKFNESPELPKDNQFKELLGGLLYIATCTRPDISHAVSIASRTSQPTQAHWNALKRILRYLKGTKTYGLTYKQQQPNELLGYSDADYANCEETRKSTSGICIFFGGAPIVWRCQRQPIITLSTTEAEYVAGCELVKELSLVRSQLTELKQIDPNKPTKVYIDNQSTVRIASNESGQNKTKHIDIRQKWLTEKVKLGTIDVQHISGEEQAADILTKPLYKTKFITNRTKLLTQITAVLSIMALCFSLAGARDLKLTDHLTTVPSDHIFVKGDVHYKIRNAFMNPCETFFNVKNLEPGTEYMLRQCMEYYQTHVLDSLKNCNRQPNIGPDLNFKTTVVDCSSKLASSDQVIREKCNTTINRSPRPQANLDSIRQSWEKHSSRIKSLQLLQRDKRVIPALAPFAPLIPGALLMGNLVLSLFTLGEVIHLHDKTSTLDASLKNITKMVDEHTELIKDSNHYFEHYKIITEDLSEWSKEVNDRIGINSDILLIGQGMTRGKKAKLVKTYMEWFEHQGKLLKDINFAATSKKIPSSINRFINASNIDKEAPYSTLLECSYQLIERNVVLDLDFVLPIIDENIEILKTIPHNHYENRTDGQEHKECWNTYMGPQHLFLNKTSGCITKLDENQVYKNVIRTQFCRDESNTINKNKLWFEKQCYDKSIADESYIQTTSIDGYLKVYCYPFNIEIDGEIQKCPNSSFILETDKSYRIANYTHTGLYIDTATKREMEIKDDPSYTIIRTKRSSLPLADLEEIASAKTDSPTALPTPTTSPSGTVEPPTNTFARLTRARNITERLKSMARSMNGTYANITQRITNLRAVNITRVEMSKFTANPISYITAIPDKIIGFLESLKFPMEIFGVLLFIVILMPLLEVIFLGIKIARIPIGLWTGSLRRVTARMGYLGSTRSLSSFRLFSQKRKRWDEGEKLV